MLYKLSRRSRKIPITDSSRAASHFIAICVAVLIICVASIGPLQAQVTTLPPGFVPDHGIKHCIFEISQPISRSTVAYVKAQYEQAEQYAALKRGSLYSCPFGRPVVWLNSPGGDVVSAIEIGRFLRSKHATTIVPQDARCASSCVLILLGGVQRTAVGKIGIHRPYGITLSKSVTQSQSTFRDINNTLRAYLREMNIPNELLNVMNAIPPGKVRWLTLDQCDSLRISGTDPAWQDYVDSETAQKIGITKSTLYKRRSIARRVCASEATFTKRMQCTFRIVQNGVH